MIFFIGWKRGKSWKGQPKSVSLACKKWQTSRKISKFESTICRLDWNVSSIWSMYLFGKICRAIFFPSASTYLFFRNRKTSNKHWEKLVLGWSVRVNLILSTRLDSKNYVMYRGLSLTDATPTYLVQTTSDNGYLRQPSLLSATQYQSNHLTVHTCS